MNSVVESDHALGGGPGGENGILSNEIMFRRGLICKREPTARQSGGKVDCSE